MIRASLAALAALLAISRVESATLAECQSEWATIANKRGIHNDLECYPNTDRSDASSFFKGTMCSAECRQHLQPLHDFCASAEKGAASVCAEGPVKGSSTLTIGEACSQIKQVVSDTTNCAAEKTAEPDCQAQFDKFNGSCSKANVTLGEGLAGRDQICAFDLEGKGCSALVEETAEMCQKRFDGIDSDFSRVCDVYSQVEAKKKGLNSYKEDICNKVTSIRIYTDKDYLPRQAKPCPTPEQVEATRLRECGYAFDDAAGGDGVWSDCTPSGESWTTDFHDFACFGMNRSASCKKHMENRHAWCLNATTGCKYDDPANAKGGYVGDCELLVSIMDPKVESKCKSSPSPPPGESPPPPPPPAVVKDKKALVGLEIALTGDEDITDDQVKTALAAALARDGVVSGLSAGDIEIVKTYQVQASAVFMKAEKDIDLAKLAAAAEKTLQLSAGAVTAEFYKQPDARRRLSAAHGDVTLVVMDVAAADFAKSKELAAKLTPEQGANSKDVKAIFSEYGDESALVAAAPVLKVDVAAEVPVSAAELEAVNSEVAKSSFMGKMVGGLNDAGAAQTSVLSASSDAAVPPPSSSGGAKPPSPPAFFGNSGPSYTHHYYTESGCKGSDIGNTDNNPNAAVVSGWPKNVFPLDKCYAVKDGDNTAYFKDTYDKSTGVVSQKMFASSACSGAALAERSLDKCGTCVEADASDGVPFKSSKVASCGAVYGNDDSAAPAASATFAVAAASLLAMLLCA